jgi:hypothetical protein
VAELALDHDDRAPFVRHLDRVSVQELMGCEASPDASCFGGVLELLAYCGGLPMPSACRPVDHADQSSDRQARSELEPRFELLPGSR